MFNLVYRDGAPENTGHYEICKTNGGTEFKVGTLVSLSGGEAVPYSSGKPYGVVAIGSKDEGGDKIGDQVAVLKITDDMIFRVGAMGGVSWPPEVNIGKAHPFEKDKVRLSLNEETGYLFEITDHITSILDEYGNIFDGGVVEGRFVYIEG